jgi:two-component system, chemotaxis family, response regulator PixG
MSTISTESIQQQSLEADLKNIIVQIQRFKQKNFSGELVIESLNKQTRFAFVFRLGRLIWVGANSDPMLYWKRHLAKQHNPIPIEWIESISNPYTPQQSSLRLVDLMIEDTLTRQELTNITIGVAIEVFFDLIQCSKSSEDRFNIKTVDHEPQKNTEEEEDYESSSKSIFFLPLLETDPILKTAVRGWQEWQSNFNTAFSPNLFPVIQKTDLISSLPENSTERIMLLTIDGTKTMRDLAAEHQYPLPEVAGSILTFLKSGSIGLSRTVVLNKSIESRTPKIIKKGITVACIDDSPLVYQTLSQILTAHGYDCYGVQEPLRIMPQLIKNKPDFIFLDLLMPIINGYEVCAQIRKTPSLKHIPVVILTGKDGLVDRMRSKMVGSTDFLSKPVSAETVLKILEKHITVRSQS